MRKQIRNVNLLISLIFVGVVILAFVVWFFLYQKTGDQVVVTVDGELYGTYDLHTDTTISIVRGDIETNVLVIQDGYAYMKEADCPDGLCIHQGRIHKAGQSIVCLPNRVVVTIESDDVAYDVLAQ